ncbi:GNAT family N-acetyltransferase [Sphingobacterium sp. UBA5996]|uniref:GNAT family N-acetyltransferase n=1 Tax=Sphingobacterium sp. UBA5996 TaxID=1947505 RepID=UPI0039C8D578
MQSDVEKPIDLESNTSKIPYLHVASDNANAIRLYQKLGFVSRRKLSFWKMSCILR